VHVLDSIDGLGHIEPCHAPVAAHLDMLCVFPCTGRCIAPRDRQVTRELHLMQPVPQVVAAHVLHLVVQSAVVLEGVIQGHDAGVVQSVQRLQLQTQKVYASVEKVRLK